jgi:hypothetical protein
MEVHMRKRSRRSLAAAILAPTTVLLVAAPASAHTDHEVGDIGMVVGFGTEPAYAGQPNSVQLILSRGDEPLTDLGNTLEVEVAFGDATMPLQLEPHFGPGFGEPGDYRGWFIPSDAGQYTFGVSGTIEGEEIDEEFASGPDTFGDVQDPAAISFPAGDVPTNAEIADRIERLEPRLTSAIEDVGASVNASVRAAEDEAAGARTFGLVGLIVGVLGLAVAAVALVRSGRRA